MAPCSTARLWSFIMLAPLKTLSKPGMVYTSCHKIGSFVNVRFHIPGFDKVSNRASMVKARAFLLN